MRPTVVFAIALTAFGLLLAPAASDSVWETRGFEAFRRGTFDSGGTNLYVSKAGTLQSIYRSDVNHDGYPDLVFNNTHDIAYVPPAYQYVFHGRGAPALTEFPGAGSVRVLQADVNGDGLPDLIVARGFDDTTHNLSSWIYWGSPTGWTESRHQELFTPYVQDVCVGDFNHDGIRDLAFIASGIADANQALIYWGTRDGFLPLSRTAIALPPSTACASADLDRDGIDDLLIAQGKAGLGIFWGSSEGLSRERETIINSAPANSVAVDHGHVVVATAQGIRVFQVAGKTLRPLQDLDVPGAARIAIGDLNHDGLPDLVVARTSFNHNWEIPSQIYWGTLRQGQPHYGESHQDLPTLGAVDATIADLDGDGYPDIVFANSRSYTSFDVPSYVYWGSAQGYSASARRDLLTHGAAGVTAAGNSVFFANGSTGSPIGKLDTYVYLGSKSGFSKDRMLRFPTVGAYESCIADLNDDGFPDILLLGSHEGDPEGPEGSTIFWGSHDGYSPDRTTALPTRGAIGCALGELDRDGYLDILFANMDDNSVAIFHGTPDRFASSREQTLHVPEPRFPAIADLNQDGYPDLLVPSVAGGVWIFWGTHEGYRQDRHTVLPGIGTVSEQIADLNGDGYLDVIVCNLVDEARGQYHNINSYIYWGSPNGYSPTNRTELPTLGAHHAVVADFNHDGHLDIFFSNYQSEFTRDLDSYIYWGDSSGSFSVRRRSPLHVGSAAGVVAADFDRDGWIDLAVSNHVKDGDHHTESPIFWNSPEGFLKRETTWLPTVGPHMMSGVDEGNLYTRKPEQVYLSEVHSCSPGCSPKSATWAGSAGFDAAVEIELRGSDNQPDLPSAPWRSAAESSQQSRFWQYRLILRSAGASSPTVRSVRIQF